MRKSSEIKALRKRMGLTCAGFAVVVGCTEPTVRNWERGLSVQPRYRCRLDELARTVAAEANKAVMEYLDTDIAERRALSPNVPRSVTLTGVAEYYEGREVKLTHTAKGRLAITAFGHNSTAVDLLHLVDWLKRNKPELLA